LRQFSSRRYADYLRRRSQDRTYSKRETDERGTRIDRAKRGRGFGALLREFWKLTLGHRATIFTALVLLTIVTLTSLSIPASTKIALDFVLTNSPGPSGIPEPLRDWLPVDQPSRLLWVIGLSVVALAIIGVSLGTIARWQMTRVTKRIQVRLRDVCFTHALALPLPRIYQYKSGGMASLLREDGGLAGELLFGMIYNPWRAIVQLVGTLTILTWVDWRMLVGGLMLFPIIWVTHKTWISRIRPLYRDAKYVRQDIDSATTEAFGGMRVVRGFSRERAEVSRFMNAQHYMARIEFLTWWWSRLVEVAWTVMIPTASAGVLVYGGTQVLKGSLTIGDLMMFSTYLLMLLGPLETLTSTASQLQNNLAALDRILDLLSEPKEFADRQSKVEVDRATAIGDIVLREVWFTYPKPRPKPGATPTTEPDQTPAADPEPVIRGVSLHARPGQTVALVGPSGGGKTTLCNLVARFYDPTSGGVFLDGVNLKDIEARSYRQLLGIVEQDVFLFDGTVAENIAYSRPRASIEDIRHAAQAANALAFINGLERGFDTVIGERGVRLSGGQKQRIAIARAILADPLILILDEATSNLDTESELLIQQSLERLMRGRTSFVIAHRLSTIRRADQILVLEKGQLTESGTHDSLMQAGGRYAELVRHQTAGAPA
jgi:ATP-binding cassette subfamily B protein/subfamily B ATP-binding cassette protein MsbA